MARMRSLQAGCGLLLTVLTLLSSIVEAKPLSIQKEACKAPTRLIYEFPLGSWNENVAVQANGQILVTRFDVPELYLVDPFHANTSILLHSFPDALALSGGIPEVTPDIFTVSSSNSSLTGETPSNAAVAWSVDLRGVSISTSNPSTLSPAPVVSEIAQLSSIQAPNGECLLSSSDSTVLISDTRQGVIYSLNTLTGSVSVAIANNYTAAVAQPLTGQAGVNGIHIRDNTLYFVNTGQAIFAKIPIHEDGTPAGATTVIAHAPKDSYYDDFALRGDYAYLVTGSGNSIEKVRLDGGGKQTIVAGSLNSTSIAGPTSAAFGRTRWDSDVLYVVTSGALLVPVDEGGQEVRVGAQVVAVYLSKC